MSEKGLPTIKEALDKAATSIKGGDLETGKEILKWVLEREPNNVLAWLWMSRCVKTNEAKLECFNRVLAIDPSNKHALEGAQRYCGGDSLQKTPTNQQPSSTPPAAQASAKQQENGIGKEKPKRRRLLMIIGGVLILLCMCSFAAVLLVPDSDEATPVASVSDDLQNELPVADSAEDLETAVAETFIRIPVTFESEFVNCSNPHCSPNVIRPITPSTTAVVLANADTRACALIGRMAGRR